MVDRQLRRAWWIVGACAAFLALYTAQVTLSLGWIVYIFGLPLIPAVGAYVQRKKR